MSGGKIHNSVNVPIDGLEQWCNANERINTNTPILIYSNSGKSAETALQILKANYANVTNIGTHKWYTFCS
jgi:rhodanese-related sulfurtransferase